MLEFQILQLHIDIYLTKVRLVFETFGTRYENFLIHRVLSKGLNSLLLVTNTFILFKYHTN